MFIKSAFCLMFICLSFLSSLKALTGLQLAGYRYQKGALYKNKYRFIEPLIIGFLCSAAVISAYFSPFSGSVITIAAFAVFSVYYINDYIKTRTKYRLTPRAIRLLFAVLILFILLHTVIFTFGDRVYTVFLSAYSVWFLAKISAFFVSSALYPFERLNNGRYIKIAKNKLNSIKAVKIAITGSFGKTGCKNILAEMLSKKYKVLKTEGNYNTPMGICITAKEIKGDEEIFIAEMGAKRVGDIKELCDIVKPRYAIITGVTSQHLSTFGNLENIYRTKKELIDCLPSDGFAVFNGDNSGSLRMSIHCPCEKEVVRLADGGIHASEIRLTNGGSTFKIEGLTREGFCINTKLLGRHNITNILLCAVLAFKLGVTVSEIAEAVELLPPVPHRLELIKNSRDITIIDDSYNANTEGAAFAYEVLKQFEGRKVIFTQGVVELGSEQFEANMNLGMMAAEVADAVILTGENTEAIRKGLEKGGFCGEIEVFDSFKEAKEALSGILRPKDVFLIQNDIP